MLELLNEINSMLAVRQTQLRAKGAGRRPDKNKTVREAEQMKAQGKSLNQIADGLSIPKSTLQYWLKPKRAQGLQN